ncbi:hypothetical protein BGZ83_008648 [Gryganskiella cystojenkinii]|nr:hypothetical protein BGZ83_008648 [Gryganskiella cystojenkinii]
MNPHQLVPTNPVFEIPELLLHATTYLTRRECFLCSRVSRTWRGYFLSFVYERIYVRQDTDGNMTPTLDDLRAFGHSIEYLTVVLPDEESYEGFVVDLDVMPLFPRVRKLSLSIETTIEGLNVWIWNCPNMQSLHIKDQVQKDEDNQHPEWFIGRCSALTELELHSDLLGDEELASALVRPLERITLSTEFFRDLSFSALTAIASTVTYLDLGDCPIITPNGSLSIICSCPNLIHVKIVTLDMDDFFELSIQEEEEQEDEVMHDAVRLPSNLRVIHARYWLLSIDPDRNLAFNESLASIRSLEKLFIMDMVALEDRPDLRLFNVGLPWILRSGSQSRHVPPWMQNVWPNLAAFKLLNWSVYERPEGHS